MKESNTKEIKLPNVYVPIEHSEFIPNTQEEIIKALEDSFKPIEPD